MKRSLLAALIACAFSAQASAQSSVSLYGIVDAWVGQTNNKVGGTSQGATGTVESGGAQASRFGMRGSEDLGGGLKVNFILEQAISVDSGTVTTVSKSNNGFNRAAYIGMTGSFGEVRLGRMLGAFDALRGSTNHLYNSSGFASTGQVWGASATAANGVPAAVGGDYLARGNNTVYYGTPTDKVFSGSVSYSFDENASTAVDAPRMVSFHGKYTSGPIRIGYGYQSERYTTGKNIFHIVAGNYNFGPAQMVAAVQRQTDERIAGHQKSNEWEVGLSAPFAGNYTAAVGYASSETQNSSGTQVIDAKGFSMMGTYDLSKRTRLYTAFRQLKTTRADGSTALDATRLGVGMTHRF